jgi:superfamily II DNA/RNA helicase
MYLQKVISKKTDKNSRIRIRIRTKISWILNTVLQLLSEGILSADTVRLVVLDEADKLLESSFLADVTTILQLLPTNKQVKVAT